MSNLIFIFSRKFSLNCVQHSKIKTFKEAAVFQKLLGSSNKKRRTYFENVSPAAGKLSLGGHKGSKENSRRIDVLNKLFIRHISDLLATSDYGENVLEKGLEISRVSVTPNFQQVNVFWSVNQEANAAFLESSLPQVGFSLRHELTQIGVVGIVPRLVFVRDKSLAQAARVDYLLSIADFGDDPVPLPAGSVLHNNSPAPTVDPQPAEQSDSLDNSDSMSGEKMPEMRHDIFGLDHNKMLSKIVKSMKKSRAIHRFHPNLVVESEGTSVQADKLTAANVDMMTTKQRKEALAKFILTRKIIESKKRMNKYNEHLRMPQFENSVEEYEEEASEEEDYIDEEEELDQQRNYSQSSQRSL